MIDIVANIGTMAIVITALAIVVIAIKDSLS